MSGSRAVIRLNCSGERVINLVRELDAEPGRLGRELWLFLSGMEIVNGTNRGSAARREAHGVGCLAAQLVSHLKTDVGGVYLEPLAWTEYQQDWEYIISFADYWKGNPVVRVFREGASMFEGTVAEFGTLCDLESPS
jgi:hypothetical protein